MQCRLCQGQFRRVLGQVSKMSSFSGTLDAGLFGNAADAPDQSRDGLVSPLGIHLPHQLPREDVVPQSCCFRLQTLQFSCWQLT